MNQRPRGTTAAAPFARLLEMLRPDLVRFAFWLARDRAVAEDVVQETLIRAWKSREELKDPAAARPWLFTIVRREHARLYERKRLPTVDVEPVEALGDPALASDGDAGLARPAARHHAVAGRISGAAGDAGVRWLHHGGDRRGARAHAAHGADAAVPRAQPAARDLWPRRRRRTRNERRLPSTAPRAPADRRRSARLCRPR